MDKRKVDFEYHNIVPNGDYEKKICQSIMSHTLQKPYRRVQKEV